MSEGTSERWPFASAVVACRNEARWIGSCLDSIVANDYHKDHLEVLVVDGMSDDGSREIITHYTRAWPFIRLLDNPNRHATAGFNVGVTQARGEVILILGAHATYDRTYISRSVQTLLQSGADNVGGVARTVPRDDTLLGRAIALAMGSGFGVGNAHGKRGVDMPRWVDTVFGGCYRREVFERIGLFDERLRRSQDMEFNLRLRNAGGKILLAPDIVYSYYVRSSPRDFWQHNVDDGFWTFFPLRFNRRTFVWRHTVPLAFVSSIILAAVLTPFSSIGGMALVGILGSYLVAALIISGSVALHRGDPRFAVILPAVFAMRHVGHGIGALLGLASALPGMLISTK